MTPRFFGHPRPERAPAKVLPVFLPQQGCPGRCAFCAQPAASGQSARPLETAYDALARQLASLLATRKPDSPAVDIGFYGGTFTLLPGRWPERFLELAADYRERGLLAAARCSTRPDALDPDRLAGLKALGLDMVELGVQSFDDEVLQAASRGHDGTQARDGCRAVRQAGLRLGIQLMAGLPGQGPAVFARDVALAATLEPEMVRLHPALVLAGTPLAARWSAGAFSPWSMGRTLAALAPALLRLWAAGIRAGRVGLAPEETLQRAILAGPWHPALGQRAASLALYLHLRRQLPRPWPGGTLLHPRRFQSDVRGHGGEMLPRLARLGLAPRPWDEPYFGLQTGSQPGTFAAICPVTRRGPRPRKEHPGDAGT